MNNLIAYVTALFLASVRSCMIKTCVMKMYGFSYFFATLSKFFAVFVEISIFAQKLENQFLKQ